MLFEFRKVGKNFGAHRVFRSLDFSLERGTFSILTGPSGSGKTTLFKMLCGVERPSEGEIIFLGRQLVTHSAGHLKHIGIVFQNPRGILDRSVAENVGLPLEIDGVSKKEIERRVTEWLDKLGLRIRANSLYRELSGGEVQKAEFARALIRKPRLILADEPTAHLDAVQADLLLDILWDHYQDGATVFISTHHPPRFEHPLILRYHVGQQQIRRLGVHANPGMQLPAEPLEEGMSEKILETPAETERLI